VNTASKCGLTPQFQGLEQLHKDYASKGLVILGFPCNQFGGQDPGSGDEIHEFCQRNYGVSFPMMEKIEVNGDNEYPLYSYIKAEKPGPLGLKRIKWNFEKFLVDKNGNVFNRYASTTTPDSLVSDIEKLLAQ
jgi:glutathione peroxidase